MSSPAVLTNLIADGAMKNGGWAGAVYDTGHAYTGARSLKLTGTATTAEVCIATAAAIPLDPAHIYYSRVYGWQDAKTNASVGFYWPIAEPSFQEGIPIGEAGKWNLYSGRTARPAFTAGSYQLRLDYNNSYIAGVMYFDGVMLLDLTATFGAGKEPDKAWCDRCLPFFEGSIEIYGVAREGISAVTITPNPTPASGSIKVAVAIESGTAWAVPQWEHSGELYAGEG